MNTTQTQTATVQLMNFINSRPCLNFADYGSAYWYRKESREITNDRADALELFSLASILYGPNFEDVLHDYLVNNTGNRLAIENGKIRYHVGQYFPTEYRPAACRVLASLIWKHLAKDYQTGTEIRKAARRMLSRRVAKYYFN